MGIFKFFFGDDNRSRAQRDQWRPSVVGKNLISPINDYGTCFSCDGTGSRTLECRACDGTGTHSAVCRGCGGTGRFERSAQQCFTCQGSGQKFGSPCRKCGGTGQFKPAISEPCRKCGGGGRLSSTCRKCNGAGRFTVTCRKCGGTGWHKFKK
jgi:DnaJ-class molecular chaperone